MLGKSNQFLYLTNKADLPKHKDNDLHKINVRAALPVPAALGSDRDDTGPDCLGRRQRKVWYTPIHLAQNVLVLTCKF